MPSPRDVADVQNPKSCNQISDSQSSVRPVDFLMIHMLDEMGHGDRHIERIRRDHDQIAPALRTVDPSSQSLDRHDQYQNGPYPYEPVGLQLISTGLEFVVGRVPPEVE